MNKKISIIVPTYNVEKYIAKCLDSLVIQDYDNYDILVVNDGSPFNEQSIIDEYQAKYPHLIKAIIKENGGYGSVLELAFNKSDAEYVLICDPDDYLACDALSLLYSYMQDTNADLVVGAKNLVFSDNEEIKYDKSFNSEFGSLEDKKLYIKGNKDFEALYFLEPSPHAKLYKRELVKNINFPHKVSYTDNLLYFYTLANVKKVTYCAKAVSYYLIDREGNTRTDLKPTIIDAWVRVFKEIMKQVPKALDIHYYRMFEAFYSVYYKVDNINAQKDDKLAKYELVYTFLSDLIPYKEAILAKNNEYNNDNSIIKKQKARLLDKDYSKRQYDSLVNNRLNGSIKQKLKTKILNNALLSKIYAKYHFYAKYYYTRNDAKMILSDNIKCHALIDEGTNFFGYYDKPCIYKGHYLIQRVNSSSLSLDQNIDIVVDNEVISKTNAWNWQQGSMASWFDDEHIIHNFFDGKEYLSKIVNIKTKKARILCAPIYSLSKNKKFALSLNFSRLAKLREDYGYFNLAYQKLKDDKKDGIYYLDIEKNTNELFLSLEKIKNFETNEDMQKAIHKVNHLDISPNSDKAIFLHRWYLNKIKYTRLLLVDLKTKKLTTLANNKMVSHMTWVNNDKVFGYLRGDNNQDGYFFIDTSGKQEHFKDPLLIDDGHPSVYNERYIITDTYPDYTCKSKLILIDTKLHTSKIIGQFYSGIKYQGARRCDLHPRFNDEGPKLTFDSVLSGQKRVYELDLGELIDE